QSASAEHTARRVITRLDEYASEWTTMYRQACRASAVDHMQSTTLLDRRMICLDRRLEDLHALLTIFTTAADRQVVQRAVSAASLLAPIDSCADAQALLAAVPPPGPDIAAAVAEIETGLAEGYQLRSAGKWEQAKSRLQPLLERARALGYQPVMARAELY